MKTIWLAAVAGSVCAAASAQTAVMTHAELQSVDSTGYTAWVESPTSFPFAIRGVILNDPEEMLDPAFNPAATTPPTGGQFQLFIQTIEADDRGGTALYMAQRSVLGDHYGEAAWSNEMRRVMYDAAGRKFRKGDLVEVTARKAVFYNGKRNVNEAHRTTVSNDFDVVLVQANAGLPQAEAIALTKLKNPDDSAIFDETRETGGEHWQGMRVRIDGIRLADTNGWGQAAWSNRTCIAVDATGRTLALRMPLTDLGEPKSTSTYFSAVGILNQESTNWIGHYELFVQEISPELDFVRTSSGGMAARFPADYEGYVLECSDDGMATWTNVDALPAKTILIEDAGAPTNRAYRLRKAD
ncbi:MAG: hypothetical protein AB7V14_07780 [Kiritimatiellia bacterium]